MTFPRCLRSDTDTTLLRARIFGHIERSDEHLRIVQSLEDAAGVRERSIVPRLDVLGLTGIACQFNRSTQHMH